MRAMGYNINTHITTRVSIVSSLIRFISRSTWLYDDADDVIVRKISRRVGDVTGLNVTFPSSEPLQVSQHKWAIVWITDY